MSLPAGIDAERVRAMLQQVWSELEQEWPPEMPKPTMADRRAIVGVEARLRDHATDLEAMEAFVALGAADRRALLDWTWPSTNYRA
jgi:hypothetical protein